MQEVFGPFVPLSRSPQLMIDAAKMGTYLRFGNTLPRALSEFAIILQARRWSQEYEWYVHAADAKTAGLTDDIIQAVAEGRRPEKMSDEQEIVYEFGRELNDYHSVTDRTYARARGTVRRAGRDGSRRRERLLLADLDGAQRRPHAAAAGKYPGLKPFPK